MVFELTGQFQNFLPALLGIAVGYIMGMLFRTEAIYEKNLEQYISDEKLYEKVKKIRLSLTVREDSMACGKPVRQIIWPSNGLVVNRIAPDGTHSVPDGETVLNAGDTIEFECETDDEKELSEYLYSIVGKPEK